jgi:hypothetical protein
MIEDQLLKFIPIVSEAWGNDNDVIRITAKTMLEQGNSVVHSSSKKILTIRVDEIKKYLKKNLYINAELTVQEKILFTNFGALMKII